MQLDLPQLTRELQHSPVGHTIDYHERIASTMPVAHQWAAQPLTRSGTIVVAEEQTAGRGRLQRQWEAPAGEALLVSIILKAPFPFTPTQLPMLAGVATAQALERFAPALQGQIGLKWPNDVLLGHNLDDAGKVAGILLESTFQQTEIRYAILGIGINVNQTVASLPVGQPSAPRPTSLRSYTGQSFDRTTLLMALCQSLGEYLTADRPGVELSAAWRSRLWTLGQAVSVRENLDSEPVFTGRALDVTADGSLVVEAENGVQRIFAAGDVSIRTHAP